VDLLTDIDAPERDAEQVEENTPTVTGMYADLLNASLSSVNWHEIAEHFIEEVDKDEEDEPVTDYERSNGPKI